MENGKNGQQLFFKSRVFLVLLTRAAAFFFFFFKSEGSKLSESAARQPFPHHFTETGLCSYVPVNVKEVKSSKSENKIIINNKMLRLHCRCRTAALPPNYSYI